MLYPNGVCKRHGCDTVITDARRPNRMYCSVYCNQRTWDLKNRTPKNYLDTRSRSSFAAPNNCSAAGQATLFR